MYAYIFRGDCFTAEIQSSDFYTLSAPSSNAEWSALKQYTHTQKKKQIQEIYFYIFVSMNTYRYTYVTITKEKEVQMRVAGLS